MNTKLKNEFKQAIQFKDKADKVEHDAKILMFKFLSLIEQEMELRNMSRKELAQQLGTSPSYITQLFRGTKTINLIKLAQLQCLFDIEFDIKMSIKRRQREKAKKGVRNLKKSKVKTLVNAN